MPDWKRVRSKRGPGHEYSVQVVDPNRHDVVDKPAADSQGRPLPAKKHTPARDRTPASKPKSDNPSKEQ